MKNKIEDVLMELGITPNLSGFNYICRSVEMIMISKQRLKIVDGLYADVATEFGTKKSRVDRAIRHAFSKIDVESEAFVKYLNTNKMTSSALLYTLAYRLREDSTDESRD